MEDDIKATDEAVAFMKNRVFDDLNSIGSELTDKERRIRSLVSDAAARLEKDAQERANQELLYKEMSIKERAREKERVAGRIWAEAKAKKAAADEIAEQKWQAYQQTKYRNELQRIRGEGIMRRVVRRLVLRDLSDALLHGWRRNYLRAQAAKRKAALKRMEAQRGPKTVYKNAHKADGFLAVVAETGIGMAEHAHSTGEVNAAELHRVTQKQKRICDL